jgi:hypothetical protein
MFCDLPVQVQGIAPESGMHGAPPWNNIMAGFAPIEFGVLIPSGISHEKSGIALTAISGVAILRRSVFTWRGK